MDIFYNFTELEKQNIINELSAKTMVYKEKEIIMNNVNNINLIGIILSGDIIIETYNSNGTTNIIENLTKNDLFGKLFISEFENNLFIISNTNSKILFIDYNNLINKDFGGKNKLIDNIFNIYIRKISYYKEKLNIISKRNIRDKLFAYFELSTKKSGKKYFYLSLTYTDLANYLSVDRSAMSRELKRLKDEGFIEINNKKITLNK